MNLKYGRRNLKDKVTLRKWIESLAQSYQMSGDINGTIGKNRNRRHRDLVESKYYQDELRSDWYNVGQDINKSIEAYDLNYRTRDEEK